MKSFLPKKRNADIPVTELLPTHKPFILRYGLLIMIGILILAVGIISFGGIIYQKGNELIAQQSKKQEPKVETPSTPKYSELTIETGYKLKKDNEWEIVTIVNEPEQAELIASSKFNATRIEISSYKKSYPTWEEKIGLTYFDVTSTDTTQINGKTATVLKGKDESLFAKTATFDDDDKIIEIRVFSASQKTVDEVFDLLTQNITVQ